MPLLSSCDNVAGYGIQGYNLLSLDQVRSQGYLLQLLLEPYFSLGSPVLNISLSIRISLPLALICFMSRAIYSNGSAWLVPFKLLICPIYPLTFLWLLVYVFPLALHSLAGKLLFPCPSAVYGCASFSLIGQ